MGVVEILAVLILFDFYFFILKSKCKIYEFCKGTISFMYIYTYKITIGLGKKEWNDLKKKGKFICLFFMN